MPILKKVDLEDSEFPFDYEIPKTADFAGLEGLPSLLLQQAEGLTDFGRILVLFAKPCKRGEAARAAMVTESVQSLLPSTRLVFVFFKWKPRFARMNLKPAVLKNFVFDWALCLRLCEVYHFQNLVGLELPIKHAFVVIFLVFSLCSQFRSGFLTHLIPYDSKIFHCSKNHCSNLLAL